MRVGPYLHLAARAAKSNVARLEFPYKLTFALTFWCNYKCETCNIWKMKPRGELALDEIRAFFARSRDFLWVDLTGGEIMLRKDLVEICRAVIESCPNLLLLHFPTNGYLTDKIESDVRAVAAMSPEKLIITVSTDGDEVTNDRIRGVEGGWRRQLETFRRLRRIPGVQVVLGMTLSQSNVDHFPVAFAAVKREIPDLGYEDFHVNIVHESEHFFANAASGVRSKVAAGELADSVDHYARLRGLPTSPVSILERAYLKRVRRYLDGGHTPVRCHALRSSCFVDSWGNVFPCTIYNRKLGSLRDVDFDLRQIWNSPAAVATSAEIWDGKCPQCWTPCEAYQSILGNALRIWDRA
jgi:MoaA/NifB/PqqE/SkfB family radical SAM enzyme